MKKINYSYLILVLLSFSFIFSSCEMIGDIFKAGAWFAIIAIVVVVAIVLWIIGKVRK